MDEKAVNDLEFEGYVLDLFITEEGTLGITVYSHDKEHSADIFVREDENGQMRVTH